MNALNPTARSVRVLSAPRRDAGGLLPLFKDPVTGIYYCPKFPDEQNCVRLGANQAAKMALAYRKLSNQQVDEFLKGVWNSTKSGRAVEIERERLTYWRSLPPAEFQEALKKLSNAETATVLPASRPIAIVDSGFMMDHPFLQSCVDTDNSIDFTGEGLEDLNGHGTMCALRTTMGGTLKLRLLNVKIIGADGSGSVGQFLNALEWLTKYKNTHPTEELYISLSVGVYSKRWGFLPCRGDCALCSAALQLADAGAMLFVAAGNISGKTACPAVTAVVRKHPNMVALAADFYPDSGIGTYTAPTTTAFTTRPIVNTRSNEALRKLVERINADPTQVALHLTLLKLLETKTFPASDETIYGELKASHPNIAEIHYFFGRSLLSDEKIQAAEREFRQAIRLNPDHPDAHHFLAIALAKQQRLEESEAEFLKAIRLDSENAQFRYSLGVLYSTQGRIDEEEGAYREAIHRDPNYAESHYNLGVLLGDRRLYSEAAKEYREAIRCNPNHDSAHYNLGRILAQQKSYEAAEREFRACLAIKPGTAARHCDLGVVCEQQGKVQEAEEQYREAIHCDPDFPQSHHNLGGLFLDRRQYREAAQEYKEAIRCKPDYASALKNLELALRRQREDPGG